MMEIYRVSYRSQGLPLMATVYRAYVKACGEADAKRILEENLDTTRYVVTGAIKENEIGVSDITVNFRHPHLKNYD